MRKFVPVRFRCHDCESLLLVLTPARTPCPKCLKIYDFSFLAEIRHIARPPTPRVLKPKPEPDPPVGPLEDEIRVVQIKNRHVGMVKRRMRVVMILRDSMHYSFSAIGRKIDRNHATVIHLYRRARMLMIETSESNTP